MEPQIHHALIHVGHICSIIHDRLQFDQKIKDLTHLFPFRYLSELFKQDHILFFHLNLSLCKPSISCKSLTYRLLWTHCSDSCTFWVDASWQDSLCRRCLLKMFSLLLVEGQQLFYDVSPIAYQRTCLLTCWFIVQKDGFDLLQVFNSLQDIISIVL